jgi:hypothetical protein
MDERLRCRRCEDVIGVYEPMIVEADGTHRETSLLKEPDPEGECFHRACFLESEPPK